MEIDVKRFGIGFEGINLYGLVAQLVRAPPCHGGGRGFEPHPGRLIEKRVKRVSHDFLEVC